MGFFAFANAEEVERIPTPDNEGWVDVKSDFSKGEMNKIMLKAPREQGEVETSLSFMEFFAEMAIKGWSFVDEAGNPVPFTIANYRKLKGKPATWLDKVLSEHIQKVLGSEVEALEGKPEA